MARKPKGPVPTPSEVTSAVPARPIKGEVVSAPEIQYIASSVEYAFLATDRALPQSIDDAETKFGLEIYDKMNNEATMAGIERALKILVLADGLGVSPSFPKPPKQGATSVQIADYDEALKGKEYIDFVLDRMAIQDRPIGRALWNLLDAPRLGHKLAETNFELIPSGKWQGTMGLKSIRTKPRQNYVFVLDQDNNFRGVIAKVPGGSIALRTGIVSDVSLIQNAIAPEKLLIFNVDDDDSNIQGRSWYRACYDPWYRKQLLKPEEVATGVQFGGGKTSIIAPEEKASSPVVDETTGKKITLSQSIANTAKKQKNGGVGVYPFGSIVQVHQPNANPAFFDSSFARQDREMVAAFLLTARSILEAKHGSKADSDSAQDLVDELKMYVREQLCALMTVLFRRLCAMSFGDDWAAKYSPVATMQKASRPDFAANATAVGQFIAGLTAAGIPLSASEIRYLKVEVLGMPEDSGDDFGELGDDVEEDEPDTPATFPGSATSGRSGGNGSSPTQELGGAASHASDQIASGSQSNRAGQTSNSTKQDTKQTRAKFGQSFQAKAGQGSGQQRVQPAHQDVSRRLEDLKRRIDGRKAHR